MPSLRSTHWLTTLSLDAPLVAVVWQEFIAQSTGQSIGPVHRILVFACVWLGYSADRWFDAFRYKNVQSIRHRFHQKYRRQYFTTWLCVLIAAIYLAFTELEPPVLTKGISLAAFSILVTVLIQKKVFGDRQNWPKSLLTAFLVTASSALFSMPPIEYSNAAETLLFIAPFGLFLSNCLLIHHWDKVFDKQHNEGLDLQSGHLRSRLITIAVFTQLSALLAWILLGSYIIVATSLSFLLMAILQKADKRIHSDARRPLADLALLSPIVLIFL